jgi:hypothetical protein
MFRYRQPAAGPQFTKKLEKEQVTEVLDTDEESRCYHMTNGRTDNWQHPDVHEHYLRR